MACNRRIQKIFLGGSFVTQIMRSGIPGDAVTVIMISARVSANVFMLIFGLTGIRVFTKIAEMPRGLLVLLIMLFAIVLDTGPWRSWLFHEAFQLPTGSRNP
ncbi:MULTISPECIES: hypothetical protein [Falsihalocynthiibacter]|uniref:hypothetical protein n=1 Tax=Falsihalocynthiibacter TaxID=2854182 RepID=UPI003001D0C2